MVTLCYLLIVLPPVSVLFYVSQSSYFLFYFDSHISFVFLLYASSLFTLLVFRCVLHLYLGLRSYE